MANTALERAGVCWPPDWNILVTKNMGYGRHLVLRRAWRLVAIFDFVILLLGKAWRLATM
jgi:hypothetical protein